MIDLKEKNKCICKKYDSFPKECLNEYQFEDSGKKVQLKAKNNEKVVLIAIDNCLITTQSSSKCDCIFIYRKNKNQKYTFLVELKGNDLKKAFYQPKVTRETKEYKKIIETLEISSKNQKNVIVSNYFFKKQNIQKLEKKENIRVHSFLHSTPQKKIPDLKDII